MSGPATTQKTAPPRPDRKSARGRERREIILAEAAKLIRLHGFHATGIDDIDTAVGINGTGRLPSL